MPSILILEDNAELLRLYGKVLAKAGHNVELVSGIPDAEQRLNTHQYDLFICDIHIGNGSSLLLLTERIKLLRAAGTRVVAISGRMKYMEACEALGVDRFIIKPVMSDVLRRMVRELMELPTPLDSEVDSISVSGTDPYDTAPEHTSLAD